MSRYLAVVEELQREIEQRSADTILPTERELAKRFSVSRPTIRHAMGLLERSGLVSRRRGRGTIVSSRKVTRCLAPVITMEEDLRRQGVALETRLLRLDQDVEAPDFVREALRLRPHSRVGRLEMLRLVSGQIISLDSRYYPSAIAKRICPTEVVNRPVSEVVEEVVGRPITTVDWEIEILPSSREVATALGITPGVPVVASTAVDSVADHKPVEVVINSYRIDRVKFRYAARFGVPLAANEQKKVSRRGSST